MGGEFLFDMGAATDETPTRNLLQLAADTRRCFRNVAVVHMLFIVGALIAIIFHDPAQSFDLSSSPLDTIIATAGGVLIFVIVMVYLIVTTERNADGHGVQQRLINQRNPIAVEEGATASEASNPEAYLRRQSYAVELAQQLQFLVLTVITAKLWVYGCWRTDAVSTTLVIVPIPVTLMSIIVINSVSSMHGLDDLARPDDDEEEEEKKSDAKEGDEAKAPGDTEVLTSGAESSKARKRSKMRKATPLQRMKAIKVILRPYFAPKGFVNKLFVVLTWFLLAINKGSTIVSPLVMAKVIECLSSQPPQEATKWILLYCVLQYVPSLCSETIDVMYVRVWQTAYAEVADNVFRHLHGLSLDWHLKKKLGNVLRSMDRGLEGADALMYQLMLYFMPAIVGCVATFVIFILHFNEPYIAGIAYLTFNFYLWVTIVVTRWRNKFQEKQNDEDNSMHDKATDSLTNFETVKYFTAEEFEATRYGHVVRKFQRFMYKSQAAMFVLNSSQALVIQLCMFTAMYIAAVSVVERDPGANVSTFVAIQLYVLQIFEPLRYLGYMYKSVTEAIVNMQNLSDLLSESPDVVDVPGAPALEIGPGKGATVRFEDVHFHYPTQAASEGLQGISFEIPQGKTTAVVGQTGSGKTTLSRLLFRFYDVKSGRITINGTNIATAQQRSVRSAIGIVPQDTVLFNETLEYNVAYGRCNGTTFPTRSEVEAVGAQAKMSEFVTRLESGWETMVGERGLKLSGGEKQRVAIARCLLKDPPIVVLDEATSALDNKTEYDIQTALGALSNRTTLVIAHRLTTVRNADMILVMKRGKIIERGTHDELLRIPGGEYYEMWSTQSQDARATPEAAPSS